jgi:hypothetical protein
MTTIGGSSFGPQLMLESIAHDIPFVGIPVNYRRRVGISSVTGSFAGAFLLGCRMMLLVLGYRFGLHGRSRRLWQDLSAAHIHARNGRRGPVHAGLAAPAPR